MKSWFSTVIIHVDWPRTSLVLELLYKHLIIRFTSHCNIGGRIRGVGVGGRGASLIIYVHLY